MDDFKSDGCNSAFGVNGLADLTSEFKPTDYRKQHTKDTVDSMLTYDPFNYPTESSDDSHNLLPNASEVVPPETTCEPLKLQNDSLSVHQQTRSANNQRIFRNHTDSKHDLATHRRQPSGRLRKQKHQPVTPIGAVSSVTPKHTVSTDQMNDSRSMDPFAHWYQMMAQYYSQYFPGYTQASHTGGPTPSFSTSVLNKTPPERQINSSSLPRRSNARPGTVSETKNDKRVMTPQQQQQQMPPFTGFPPNLTTSIPAGGNTSSFDYAAYYYHYYYGAAAAAAAAQLWCNPYPGYSFPGQTGRQTPRLYHTPHIRVWLTNPSVLLQILPTRPLNGELALVELIDFGAIVDQALTEANIRITELEHSTVIKNLDQRSHGNSQHDAFISSGATSGLESPEHLSSINPEPSGGDLPEDEENGAQVEMCAAIAAAWGRADHLYYPGPLRLSGTLKADVLAFLRDRMDDMQDRLPIDWESAGLLLAYLELLIKNNGRVQTGDLVHLLLEGIEPQSTSRFQSQGPEHSGGTNVNLGVSLPYNRMQVNNVPSYLSESLSSLNLSGGFQSPQVGYRIQSVDRHQRPASETGGELEGSRALIRRAAAVTAHHVPNVDNQRSTVDNRALDRFRELLLHGMVMKALEHACHTHLWGHAFVLSQRIGSGVFNKIVDRFLSSALSPFDPLLTLYQITAGEIPQSINSATFRNGMENGEWRPHLAMILSTESAQPELTKTALERLGDSLLSRRLVYAAHLCFLLMGPQRAESDSDGTQKVEYRLPPKIWLLGLSSSSPDIQNDVYVSTNKPFAILDAPTEAFHLTEIYEYAMRLANRDYYLPQLLPFKLVYVTRLLDSGLLSKASRYLNTIGLDLLRELDRFDSINNFQGFISPIRYSLVTNCLRLAEPLQGRTDVLLDLFDVSSSGGDGSYSENTFGLYGLADQQQRMNDSSNVDWLVRLRELYYRMNLQLQRPSFGMIDFRQPAVLASQSVPTTPTGHPSFAPDQPDGSSAETKPGYSANSAVQLGSHQPPYSISPTDIHDGYAYSVTPQQRQHSSLSSSQNPYANTHSPASCANRDMSSSVVSTRPSHTDSDRYSGVTAPTLQQQQHHHHHYQPVRLNATPYLQQQQPQPQSVGVHQHMLHQPESVKPLNQAIHSTVPSQAAVQQHVSTQPGNTSNQPQSHPSPYQFQMPSSIGTHLTLEPPHSPLVQQQQQQQLNCSTVNNHFFTPLPVVTDLHGSDAPSFTSRPTFDYFAGMQHPVSRSRTVSASSQNSSTVPSSPNSMQGNRSRNNSGMSQSQRRSSLGLERHTIGQQPQTVSHQMNSKHTHHSSVLHQPPIKEESQSDGGNRNVNKTQQQIKQEEIDTTGSQSQDSTKKGGGWFWDMLGLPKRNSSRDIRLPDDSKRSIIWDEKSKQWRDTSDPDSSVDSVQLPPPLPPNMLPAQSAGNLPLNHPAPLFHASGFPPTVASADSGTGARSGTRSRYVNVLANQTSGSASSKLEGNFQPPLPSTMFPPHVNSPQSERR